ncbi:MAG: LPS-assembly protein LptD, partial [Bdellovibrionaceae bacterium]|nr:LPS-assembly protein LptD [Pseudobdellovibrionaceae bacterium]
MFIFLFIALFLHVFSSPAHAQIFSKKEKTKILLNANFIERDNEKDLTILRDNVQIIFEQNFISCNEAIVVWAKNEVIAVGKVLLKTQKSDIQADKLVYNFKDQTGKIFNGVVLSGKVLLQSDYIEKTGPDSYVSNTAYLTSCTTCAASWSFTSDSVDATIEGYAYVKNAWLHVLEFPILYMPYLVLPLKNERQSGLLTPNMEVNPHAGFGFELPYFWAMSRSQDMTISAKHYNKSGLQGLVNYRYRLSDKSSGELDTAMLWDEKESDKRRWHNSYSHYLELPNNYIQRTSVSLTSDLDYVEDFQQQFPFFGYPALDNRTSITKNFEDFHLSVDTSYYISLLQDDISAGRESSVH